jgi:hypothetical protein
MLSGVAEGATVVVHPSERVKEGVRVESGTSTQRVELNPTGRGP